jgi:hypothetical protein
VAFLTLNGVAVRVAVDSVSMSYADSGGEMERSPSGELGGGPSSSKREWKMTTTPIPASEVEAWVGLIEGKGHSWSFDASVYSARGRGVEAGGSLATVSLVGGAKYGAAAASVSDDGDTPFSAVPYSADWTLLGWLKDVLGSGWHHFVFNSGLVEWQGGVLFVAGQSAQDFFNVHLTPGQLDFNPFTYGPYVCDDVVYLPYAVPDAWAAGMYARHAASAWSALPRVVASGAFASSSVTVRGKVTDMKAERVSLGGGLTTGYRLEFTLREV